MTVQSLRLEGEENKYLLKKKRRYKEKKKKLWLFGGASASGASCGLAYAHSCNAWSDSDAYVSARLAVKSEALANYFGQQFIDIWSDYVALPRKEE